MQGDLWLFVGDLLASKASSVKVRCVEISSSYDEDRIILSHAIGTYLRVQKGSRSLHGSKSPVGPCDTVFSPWTLLPSVVPVVSVSK